MCAQATVIKFTRELAAAPMEQGAREAMCAYIDAFSRWDEAARIEQYAMLHFDWATRAGEAQHAVRHALACSGMRERGSVLIGHVWSGSMLHHSGRQTC